MAIKTDNDIFVFQCPVMLSVLFKKQSQNVNNNEVMSLWHELPEQQDPMVI